MTDIQWPDARKAVHELVKAHSLAVPYYLLPAEYTELLPVANTWVQRSTEGYIDRVTWVVVDVYAEPGESIGLAEEIVSAVANQPHDVPGVGFLDDVAVEQPPTDVPRPDGVEQSQTILKVTTRPH